MEQTRMKIRVGGWRAPCVAFDYEKMERDARRECEAVRAQLERKKREKASTAEQELLRRREVRMLTDIYYEQRGNALTLAAKKRERREQLERSAAVQQNQRCD